MNKQSTIVTLQGTKRYTVAFYYQLIIFYQLIMMISIKSTLTMDTLTVIAIDNN